MDGKMFEGWIIMMDGWIFESWIGWSLDGWMGGYLKVGSLRHSSLNLHQSSLPLGVWPRCWKRVDQPTCAETNGQDKHNNHRLLWNHQVQMPRVFMILLLSIGSCWGVSQTSMYLTSSSLSIQGKCQFFKTSFSFVFDLLHEPPLQSRSEVGPDRTAPRTYQDGLNLRRGLGHFYCRLFLLQGLGHVFFIIGDIAKSWICFFIVGDYCYCKVWDMVEERALQLAPPPGHSLTAIFCSLSFEMFCFVFTHFLPLFMPGRTHQSKSTASQTQPQALHHQPPVHHPATKTSQDPCGPLCTSPPSSFSCASYLFHFLLPAQSVSDLG